jgi:hypothetical protein
MMSAPQGGVESAAPLPVNDYSVRLLVWSSLSGVGFTASGIEGAFCKINRLAALGASVRLVELIREDLFFLPAFRALAGKRLESFKLFKTGAVLRRSHSSLLL